jgi:hypothetical protein
MTNVEPPKASLGEVRKYFEDGGPKMPATEMMACKKDRTTGEEFPDYDQIATGLGDGSLTYEISEEQKKRAQAITHHPDLRIG